MLTLDPFVRVWQNRTPTLPVLCDPAAGLTQVGEALAALGTPLGADRVRDWHAEVRAREQRRDEEINVMGAAPPSEQNFLNPVHLCKALETAMRCDGGEVARRCGPATDRDVRLFVHDAVPTQWWWPMVAILSARSRTMRGRAARASGSTPVRTERWAWAVASRSVPPQPFPRR